MAIVYQHRRVIDGEVFYIGISKNKKRPFCKNRSQFWKNYTSKYEYVVEILFDNISWEEACNIEKNIINMLGRRDINTGCLINQTDGGEGRIGHKLSQEALEKIRNHHLGKPSGMLGKKHSEDTKKIMRDTHLGENNYRSKKVLQFTRSGLFIAEYDTLSEAAIKTNQKSHSNIVLVCNGKRNHAGGFIWKYKN